MTRAEVLALEGRALDAAVAERVFGRRRYRYAKGTRAHLIPPEEEPEKSEYEFSLYEPVGPEVKLADTQRFPIPKFHADAAADYEVLRRVRETWDVLARWRFHKTLLGLWYARTGDSACSDAPLLYAPGDYAKAALLSLAEEEPC